MHATPEQMSVWGLIGEASLPFGASERLLQDFLRRFRGTTDLVQLYREGSDGLPGDASLERLSSAPRRPRPAASVTSRASSTARPSPCTA